LGEFSQDPKGYYAMLEVSVTADADEIKAAFRTKAKRLHPDINPSPIAAKQFQRLSEAYEILSDPERRNAYDAKSGRKKPSSSNPKSEKPASEKQTSKAGPDAEKESKEKKDESARLTKSENANAQRSKASQNSKKLQTQRNQMPSQRHLSRAGRNLRSASAARSRHSRAISSLTWSRAKAAA